VDFIERILIKVCFQYKNYYNNYSGLILEHKMPDEKEILHYLRAKYFKIYSLKMFVGQKKSLVGLDLARGPPYAHRCSNQLSDTRMETNLTF
jgi:hypothetical protein